MAIGDDFNQVLGAARAGAEWAWIVIYDDLAPAMLRYLRAGGAKDAEDLTGEVFLQLVTGLGRFEGTEGDLRAWAFVIAHHRLVDERRRRMRRPEVPTASSEILEARSHGNVEDEALESLARSRVERVLATLTEDQRDVLMLRILGGLTVDEVAQAVGKRSGAVKALQRRGIAALRREISSGAVSL